MNLTQNMGTLDRTLRTLAGLVLLYIGLFGDTIVTNQIIRYVLVGVGAINIVTSLVAVCPLYFFANISTKPKTPTE